MCDDTGPIKRKPLKFNPNLSGYKQKSKNDPSKELLVLRFNTSSNKVRYIPSLPTYEILENQQV